MEETKDIETFIKFLKKFYNFSEKRKNKLIKMVTKKDQNFGNWLQSVRDFNYDMQTELYQHLRCSTW